MEKSRDSSFWRSLAVALGDGLAFGVGVTLLRAASRPRNTQTSVEPQFQPGVLTDRARQVGLNAKRIEHADRGPVGSNTFDQKVLEAIVKALEARLNEHSGQVEHRLTDLDARIAIELRSLDRQDQTIARNVSEEIGELQQQMVTLHREFAEAVARIVAEQVSSQVEKRAAAIEAAIESRVPAAVSACLEPLEQQMRIEMEQRDREIAELRQQLADTDANVRELILGIGRICRQAADRSAPHAASNAA